jgi:O-antigen/teichoic acid export membrane protein
MFAFLEGLGKVKQVAKYRFFQISLGLLIVWFSLGFGAKLLTAGVNSLTWVLVAIAAFTLSPFGAILRKIYQVKVVEKVSYVKEIFPFQWKIAISWISGYFIFQLFNPVLFATDGAVIAGQMGMTLTALTGIQSLSYSWTSTKVPTYSGMIEMKRYGQLDNLFNRTLHQAVGINACCLLLFFFVIFAIRQFHLIIFGMYLGDRFLPYLPLAMMMIPEFANQFITAWATYLRCHKKEPFLINSAVTGILCCLSTVGLGKLFGVNGITIGYCAITLAITPWAYYIFITKKKQWHHNPA